MVFIESHPVARGRSFGAIAPFTRTRYVPEDDPGQASPVRRGGRAGLLACVGHRDRAEVRFTGEDGDQQNPRRVAVRLDDGLRHRDESIALVGPVTGATRIDQDGVIDVSASTSRGVQ
ncbi:hypothetical protein SAMN04515671_3529 [Nakamurella panacisegetis]|uniref:Uncharacterized protein n=1 Tax=Nakamurella panacisegetis TaxID=1090615 RepID=A0A1H0REF4_9ACTN|nr:hypothetical protein SAMN04515671_3529 [Nakamurella panacisegetis]